MVRRWLCLCVVAVALGACGHRAYSPRILLLHEDIDSIRDATPAQIQFLLEQEIRSRIDASLTQLGAVMPTADTPPTPTPATPATSATPAAPATPATTAAAMDAPDIMGASMPDQVLPDDTLADDALLFDSLAEFSIPGHLSLECDGICQNATLSGDVAIAVDTEHRGFALENIHLQDIDQQFFLRGNVRRLLDDEQIVAPFFAEAELLLETPHEQIMLDPEATLTIDAIPQSQSDDAYGLIELSHGDSNTVLSGAYSSLAPNGGG